MNKYRIYRKIFHRLCVLAFMILFTTDVCAQQISVKTNAVMLGSAFPNIGAELVVGKRISLEISGFGCYMPYKKDITLIGGIPELKYWFVGRPMARAYVGVNALLATYNIKWDNSVYEGDAGGLGLGFGYSLVLSPRWNLEFGVGIGTIYFRQQSYPEGETFDYYFANNKGFKLFPTKLSVAVAYIIK